MILLFLFLNFHLCSSDASPLRPFLQPFLVRTRPGVSQGAVQEVAGARIGQRSKLQGAKHWAVSGTGSGGLNRYGMCGKMLNVCVWVGVL